MGSKGIRKRWRIGGALMRISTKAKWELAGGLVVWGLIALSALAAIIRMAKMVI